MLMFHIKKQLQLIIFVQRTHGAQGNESTQRPSMYFILYSEHKYTTTKKIALK